jgi:hypothetical protein
VTPSCRGHDLWEKRSDDYEAEPEQLEGRYPTHYYGFRWGTLERDTRRRRRQRRRSNPTLIRNRYAPKIIQPVYFNTEEL